MRNTAVLLIDCPDRKGLVAGVANLLYRYGANITHADQHQDPEAELFFMRVEWDLTDFDLPAFRAEFESLAGELQMRWRLNLMSQPPRVAIFVSQYLHCLADLLHRHQTGELHCEIPLMIGNHADGAAAGRVSTASSFTTFPSPRVEAPARGGAAALAGRGRYRPGRAGALHADSAAEFVERYPARIINVHHSFLPAFIGARPYHAAFHRGVKLIGATSHYVTRCWMTDRSSSRTWCASRTASRWKTSIRKGRDLERVVLSRAVAWHLDHRILATATRP